MGIFAAPIEVIRAALLRLGDEDIADLNDGSPQSVIANANYELKVRAALTRHAWSFATRVDVPTYQGISEDVNYPETYTLPPDQINIMAVECNGYPVFHYRIESGRLLVPSQGNYTVRYQFRAVEGQWPDDFTEAMVLTMQAIFLWGLQENRQDARMRENDAEEILRQALRRDKRQSPGTPNMRSAMVRRWRGFGRNSQPRY